MWVRQTHQIPLGEVVVLIAVIALKDIVLLNEHVKILNVRAYTHRLQFRSVQWNLLNVLTVSGLEQKERNFLFLREMNFLKAKSQESNTPNAGHLCLACSRAARKHGSASGSCLLHRWTFSDVTMVTG